MTLHSALHFYAITVIRVHEIRADKQNNQICRIKLSADVRLDFATRRIRWSLQMSRCPCRRSNDRCLSSSARYCSSAWQYEMKARVIKRSRQMATSNSNRSDARSWEDKMPSARSG